MQLSNHAVGAAMLNVDAILAAVNRRLTHETNKISYPNHTDFLAKTFRHNKANHAVIKLMAKYLYQLQCLKDLVRVYQDEMLLQQDMVQLQNVMLNKINESSGGDNKKYFEYGKQCINNKFRETTSNLDAVAFSIWYQLQIIFLSFADRKDIKKNISQDVSKLIRDSLFTLKPLYRKISAGNLAQPLASCFECYKVLATLAADVPSLDILRNSSAGINDRDYEKYLKKHGIDCRLSRPCHPDLKMQLFSRQVSSDFMDGMTLLAGLVDWPESVVKLKIFEPRAVAVQVYYVATMLYFIYDVMHAANDVKRDRLDNVMCFVEKAEEAMSGLAWMRQSQIKNLYQDALVALRAEHAMFDSSAAVVQVGCMLR